MKTVNGFQNRPIGIPSDVRSALDDDIWTEIWGDGKDLIQLLLIEMMDTQLVEIDAENTYAKVDKYKIKIKLKHKLILLSLIARNINKILRWT